MKVLHFGRFHNDQFGGLERVVTNLLKGLSRSIDVTNLVANERLHTESFKFDGYRIYKVPSLGVVAGTALCPTMPYWARRLHREQHFDIVHLHFPDPMSHLAALALPAEVKLVIHWHSDIVHQKKLFKLYRPFLDRIVERADAIVAATPKHFSSSRQLGAAELRKQRVIPYGIDFETFENADAVAAGLALRRRWGKRFVIFAVGRHVYYKGIEFLIRAMLEVSHDTLLVLGGSGPLTTKLKRLAASLELNDRVLFIGRIPEEDLPAYYHAADVFCLPSVEPSEAFGLVQVEAMACRKPVVCCELGNGVTYVNQHNVTGLVVPPRDPAALAAALNRLLSNDELRRDMGTNGYARAKREFTLPHMWQETLKFYESLTETRLTGALPQDSPS
jgi:glycosyltransferase involved in cell wall biosynthesis